MPVAVITGASRGLGRALATELATRGWSLVLDARDATPSPTPRPRLPGGPHRAIPGDVTDPPTGAPSRRCRPARRRRPAGQQRQLARRQPAPRVRRPRPGDVRRVLEVNVVAPMALVRDLLPGLRERGGRILAITSDAAVEPYETWGAYGSSKAALDHATRILAAEEPSLRVYAVDPGDMRTQMHQDAFPGEDISDRPEPETAVPALLRLVSGDLPSGRYRASDLAAVTGMSTPAGPRFRLPEQSRRPARPRPAAWPATRSGWPWSPGRHLPRTGPLASRVPPARRPGRGEHQRDAARRRRRRPPGLHLAAARLHPARRRVVGGRAPAPGQLRPGRADRGRGAPPARRSPAAGRRAPYPPTQRRLWRVTPLPALDRVAYLTEHGRPIRYPYLDGDWPLATWQNVYADQPGSAEMPSAGRPLTSDLLVRLMARGIPVAPVVLHTGVSSQEAHEPPQPEEYTVPEVTARLVNGTVAAGSARGRGRHHRRPRARVGRTGRAGGPDDRLDRPRARPSPAGPGRVRPADRAARAGGQPSRPARGGGRWRAWSTVATPTSRPPRRRATCGTSSATPCCCCPDSWA